MCVLVSKKLFGQNKAEGKKNCAFVYSYCVPFQPEFGRNKRVFEFVDGEAEETSRLCRVDRNRFSERRFDSEKVVCLIQRLRLAPSPNAEAQR
jgi:hypothetical protein